MWRYATTIFLSAFLLFQVQPLIGKAILPWFGGTPAVWTTCMLFFQLLLLAGYAYAHVLSCRFAPRTQFWVHAGLLAVSLLFLPIAPAANWKPSGDEIPSLYILSLLAATIGVPYLLLSATGPLLQGWFSRCEPGRSPYRLYALSNAGSLLALISYPLLVEPAWELGLQSAVWSTVYALFVAMCGYCAWLARTAAPATGANLAAVPLELSIAPAWSQRAWWLALSACGSVMLLATTNLMCQDVAVVPLLWVLPLALYLVTFIVAFEGPRWYVRSVWGVLLAVCAVAACVVYQLHESVRPSWQLATYAGTLLVCCMVCHGELARSKPVPRHLTLFYLCMAIGGALGGTLVAIVAPLVFRGYWEYHLGLGCTVLLALIAFKDRAIALGKKHLLRNAGVPLTCFSALLLAVDMQASRSERDAVAMTRNFYGVLRVLQRDDVAGCPQRVETHGHIVHGIQFLEAEKRRWPTAYYGASSGAGLALLRHPARQPAVRSEQQPARRGLAVGVIGLGAGTLAVHGQAGDRFCFYEINPEVVRMAREQFSFLADSPTECEIVLGDARLQLERQAERGQSANQDVLIVDAFSGDAIPMHLLTREAMRVYDQHLKTDGLLAFHISNDNLDLKPVVRTLAADNHRQAVWIRSAADPARSINRADWVIVTNNREFLDDALVRAAVTPWPIDGPQSLLWTDAFGSIRQVL